MSPKEKLYSSLPVVLQNVVCNLEGARIRVERYGRGFRIALRDSEERMDWSPERMQEYRRRRLQAHFVAAAGTSFWAQRFQECDVHPTADDAFSELQKLPVLSKREVQDASSAIAAPLRNGAHLARTSGTTGGGLVFPESLECEQERFAIWWRYRRWHRIHLHTYCGYFGGRSIVPVTQRQPPYWRSNRPGRQLLFSAYHLNARTAESYYRALVSRGDIEWLHGYPSVLSLLASLWLELGFPRLPALRIVTIGAESLLPAQRLAMERAWGVPVAQHYGLAETAANISQHPDGLLRVDEDVSHVELLPVQDQSGHYRLIGTNWLNPLFPLFRYDTGDIVSLRAAPKEPTWPGREIEEIDGRKEDFLTLPDGTRLGRLDHILKDFVSVREAQFVQAKNYGVTLLVVPTSRYDEAEEARLRREIRLRIGGTVPLQIQRVETVPRTPAGKIKFVVSEI